jgi:hypothetical protein
MKSTSFAEKPISPEKLRELERIYVRKRKKKFLKKTQKTVVISKQLVYLCKK